MEGDRNMKLFSEKFWSHVFEQSCGKGCDTHNATIEWYRGDEHYHICGGCGESPNDCQCEVQDEN